MGDLEGGDLGQQFQIPQVTEVSFSMTNVRTGLRVKWSGRGSRQLEGVPASMPAWMA